MSDRPKKPRRRRLAGGTEPGAAKSAHVGTDSSDHKAKLPWAFCIDVTPAPPMGQVHRAADLLITKRIGLRLATILINDDHTLIAGHASSEAPDLLPDLARAIHAAVGGTLVFDVDADDPEAFLEGLLEEHVHTYLRAYGDVRRARAGGPYPDTEREPPRPGSGFLLGS